MSRTPGKGSAWFDQYAKPRALQSDVSAKPYQPRARGAYTGWEANQYKHQVMQHNWKNAVYKKKNPPRILGKVTPKRGFLQPYRAPPEHQQMIDAARAKQLRLIRAHHLKGLLLFNQQT